MEMNMKKTITIAIALMFSISAFAATGIYGKVTVKVKNRGTKRSHKNIVIFLESLYRPVRGIIKKTLKQKGKKFSPRVLPVIVGSKVTFPNQDPYNHNVFSPTKGYKFDLGYYPGGKSKTVTFKRSGAVRIYCNIHSSMVADILVVPNKYFAKTKRSGRYKIKGIPPGRYTFIAWQPTGAAEKRNVVIKAGKMTKINFKVVQSIFKVKHKNKFGQAYEKDY